MSNTALPCLSIDVKQLAWVQINPQCTTSFSFSFSPFFSVIWSEQLWLRFKVQDGLFEPLKPLIYWDESPLKCSLQPQHPWRNWPPCTINPQITEELESATPAPPLTFFFFHLDLRSRKKRRGGSARAPVIVNCHKRLSPGSSGLLQTPASH